MQEKMSREELIERVMDDIETNYYSYRDWILDVIKDLVKEWDIESLLNHLGIDREEYFEEKEAE